jgi:hypothetical protein
MVLSKVEGESIPFFRELRCWMPDQVRHDGQKSIIYGAVFLKKLSTPQ